ncbi:hypothetical protein ACOIC7_30375, partial [Klebsiella pneumoniae]|uniref:hypothetical protein n=1 Tax=Klebsiella pneumoniae TaxID=573 RepID=UPI003B5A4988
APSVVAAYRGMVVEVPLHLGAMDGETTADRLREALREYYAGSQVVRVCDDGALAELLLHADQPPSDGMGLHVRGNAEGY